MLASIDEEGRGFSFRQENSTTLALHEFMSGSDDPMVLKIARRYMAELFTADDPRKIVNQYRRKSADEIPLAVHFFRQQGCDAKHAYALTRQALNLEYWSDDRIRKAAKHDTIERMLSQV